MDVYLDTNVIINNYFFDTHPFEALFNYLRMTKGQLFISSVVKAETFKHYRDDLSKTAVDLEKSYRCLFGTSASIPSLDVEKAYKEYEKLWHAKEKAAVIKIVPHANGSTIDVILSKAIEKKRPFDENGRGFADAIIWHSFVGLVTKTKRPICLITQNAKDFGRQDLHEDLKMEMGSKIKLVTYFNSIDDFLGTYQKPISFIDDKFINDFCSQIAQETFETVSLSTADIRYRDEYDYDELELDGVEVENFYLVKSSDEHYLIEVSLSVGMRAWYTDYDIFQDEKVRNSSAAYASRDVLLWVNKKTRAVDKYRLHWRTQIYR